ncbi:MAG: VOC family protein [Candidatus Freyarchaeota archaeon]|nr:VOC family protein [Candidatus Jordarchaeia archaeon]
MIRLHHVGVVVKDLRSAISKFCCALGVDEGKIVVRRGQYSSKSGETEEFEYAFIPSGNGTMIELVMPTSEGPTMRFLNKRGEGLFHLAFEVDDMRSATKRFEEADIPLAGENIAGKTVSVFFHPKHAHGVLLQLVKEGLFLPDGEINPEAFT